MSNEPTEKEELLQPLEDAKNIRAWYDAFTKIMAARKHHSVIEGEDLDVVARQVVALAQKAYEELDSDAVLLSAAALGRLAAVARGREASVYGYIDDILVEDPIDIDLLADGDEKEYAAVAISHSKQDFLLIYCLRQALQIKLADKARKVLLKTGAEKSGDMASLCSALGSAFAGSYLAEEKNARARMLVVRRVFGVLQDVLTEWDGPVGDNPGEALSALLSTLSKPRSSDLDDDDWFALADSAAGCMLRIVELRFSYALQASTYAVLDAIKSALGRDRWLAWLDKSPAIRKVQVCIAEAALVLARQGKQDPDFVEPMLKAFGDRKKIAIRLASHFRGAPDLDPATRLWWEKAGNVRANDGVLEQQIGSGFDDMVGALLVEIETAKEGVGKLESAVAPLLKISDPPLASKVSRTSRQFSEISQLVRRLARARKLSLLGIQGEEMEYNPRVHVVVDGSRSGVRRVRIVRDGVQKNFGGREIVIVKAWVTPVE